MQGFRYLTRDALDAANRLYIQLLWRELDRSITGMNTSKLDMLRDGISQNLPILSHCIHLYLLGMFDKLRHDDRMILRHVSC